MSGATKMYSLRPIVQHDLPVELPNCMYKIKNIHSARNGTVIKATHHVVASNANLDISEQDNTQLPEMSALVVRQEHLLKQLLDLKEQMQYIRADLKIESATATPCSSSSNTSIKFDANKLPDVVINVNPSNPPFSLLLLQRVWANMIELSVQTHLHSSVAGLPENAQKLSQDLSNFKSKSNVPKVAVRLIWKNIGVNQMELVITSTPILGETNFLRYIARMTNTLNYDENNFDIDSLLDISYVIARSRTKTERAPLLQALSKRVSKSDYLCGKTISIADISVYSAVKQVAAANEINTNLNKWLQKCENC